VITRSLSQIQSVPCALASAAAQLASLSHLGGCGETHFGEADVLGAGKIKFQHTAK
jgi:hypothetical protein